MSRQNLVDDFELVTKKEAIRLHLEGVASDKIADKFKVPLPLLAQWFKNKSKIMKQTRINKKRKQSSSPKKERLKQSDYSFLDPYGGAATEFKHETKHYDTPNPLEKADTYSCPFKPKIQERKIENPFSMPFEKHSRLHHIYPSRHEHIRLKKHKVKPLQFERNQRRYRNLFQPKLMGAPIDWEMRPQIYQRPAQFRSTVRNIGGRIVEPYIPWQNPDLFDPRHSTIKPVEFFSESRKRTAREMDTNRDASCERPIAKRPRQESDRPAEPINYQDMLDEVMAEMSSSLSSSSSLSAMDE